MDILLSIVLPLYVLCFGQFISVTNGQRVLEVSNGMDWGLWGTPEMCPSGTYATGFSLLVESDQGFWGDNTALNAIALRCSIPISSGMVDENTTITSTTGSWGSWTDEISCPSGVLNAFQLRVEDYQGWFNDDTAANNIRFTCTGNQVLEGDGNSLGSWGSWSLLCDGTGICGIQTRVELSNGWDETSLNDVRFYCC